MATDEPTSNGKPSFFRRVRRFLAWDGWIVRRELPEGFRLRRYVARNAVGALCGLGLLAGAVALIRSVPPKGCVERVFYELTRVSNAIAGSFDVNVTSASMPMDDGPAPCWFLFGIGLGLVALWLVLHCGSRVVFAPRKNDKTESCGMFDAGRFLAGIIRPVILLWVLYVAATPVRPLDLHPVSPSMIPDWLKDENGNIVRPREFLVAEGECPDWNAFGWSNLVERLGEPLPPEIRLVYEMREYGVLPHDKGLGEKANRQLADRFWEARTNLVSLSGFPDEMREEVEEWMAVCGKRLSRYEQCTGPQTWRFVVTNGPRSAIEQGFSTLLPTFGGDVRHATADLLFSADSGSAEDFSEAARRADVFRSACLRFEDGLVPHLISLLVSSVKTADVVRFCERKDVDSASFAVARRSIGEAAPSFPARGTARACALDTGYSPSLLKPVYEELGVAFWKVPRFGFYPRNSRPGPFMRRVGALTMFASGCDYRGFLAGVENIQSYRIASAAASVDPEVDEDLESYCRFASSEIMAIQDSPSFREWWRRGGIGRRTWNHTLPVFDKFIRKALFADAFPAVEDAALQLAQFRTEKGHDAESLEEAAAAIGAGVPDTGSAFFDLRYARIEPPESAVPGSSAYALALVPKETSRLREAGCDCAWIVVRNPSFPGTRPSRIYVRERPDGSTSHVLPGSNENPLAVAEGAPASENARFTIPAALFGPDPEAIDAAERMMEEDGWTLK